MRDREVLEAAVNPTYPTWYKGTMEHFRSDCFFCAKGHGECKCVFPPEQAFLYEGMIINHPNRDETFVEFVDPVIHYGDAYLEAGSPKPLK